MRLKMNLSFGNEGEQPIAEVFGYVGGFDQGYLFKSPAVVEMFEKNLLELIRKVDEMPDPDFIEKVAKALKEIRKRELF